MLPDLRYVIGAILATAFLAVNSLGLFVTVQLAHPAKLGPIEASRPMAFADRVDWNQFADPDGVWRLDELARKFGGMNAATKYAPEIQQPRHSLPRLLRLPNRRTTIIIPKAICRPQLCRQVIDLAQDGFPFARRTHRDGM